MKSTRLLWLLALVPAAVLPLAVTRPAEAQDTARAQANHANWPLAERFSADALRSAVYSTSLTPRWIAGTDSLWYSWKDAKGTRFELLVPKTRTRRPLFDHVRFAADLSALAHKPYEANALPMTALRFERDGRTFSFVLDSIKYVYDLDGANLSSKGKLTRDQIAEERTAATGGAPTFRSFAPDSTVFVFAREHNLYVVELKARLDTVSQVDTVQITTDGVKDYSFGARDTAEDRLRQDSADNIRSRDPRVRASVVWSPDSRAFAITRNDSRAVADLYLVDVLAAPRPRLVSYKYAMPGEEKVPQQELYLYRRGEKQLTPVSVDRWRDQRLLNLHFPTGADRLRLVRRDRLQRNLELIEIDLATRQITPLLSESTEFGYLETQPVQYLKAGGDFVWWSERSGWGHLYLYGHDGKLKQALTAGPWRVDALVDVDTMKRAVFFAGVGREAGENVYYRHLYRIAADGAGLTLLDSGNATHNTSLSPSKRFALDNYSRIDLPSRAVIRDARGGVWMDLETSDMSALEKLGWKPPEGFLVKAADGITDIYGVMWRPNDFDPARKYPIIAHVYPGPQTETVTHTFSPNAVNYRLAQLGFIVIQIGNRGGSPQRSNAYHSYGYYNLRDYGLADKKAGIEQLAARYPWIDLERVGIYGHSGGGFMTAAALLLPPYNEFFKVGVSSSGNHDNNVYNQNWSEQHHGLREVPVTRKDSAQDRTTRDSTGAAQQRAETRFEIKVPANHELAANLKGRLLLVHGDMDNNVHPAGTIRLANALIKANKRFDFFLMPGKPHAYGDMQEYFTRMMFEYFAEHLLHDYYRNGAEIR
ncbi:MAG: S9 family peptidase [Gemmatimonadetes bacterium]|nr:S9 family peptidase [Gemmatimonadota bacterium]